MVQLGYVDSTETLSSAKCACGGTLLSEWFILTAGHCTSRPKKVSAPNTASNDTITLSPSAVPACLDVFGGDTSIATSTGWGLTENNVYSNMLLKVSLNQFTYEECQRKYSHPQNGPRHMKSGVNESTQICYGHRHGIMDTCTGDSAGPLTIRNPRVDCMYSVVGIVSLGPCGVPEKPGIYTKVSHFVPWIESVVWPDEE